MCLPVVQEILQGLRDEQAHRVAKTALLAMPIVGSPMHEEIYLEAADLHQERDFSALAKVSIISQRQF